jgi:Family of unknown function (DUF6535)
LILHARQQATFFAGLQAQMLSASLPDNSTTPAQLVNAFWLSAIFLNVFGAVLSTLTARWFELLGPDHVEIYRSRGAITKPHLPRHFTLSQLLDWVIAKALFSGLGIVSTGVTMFLIGLIIYVWEKQPLLVCIMSTIPVVVLAPLVAGVFFYPHSIRKTHILQILAEGRGAW